MTPEETVILTRYVRALCPGQRFDEYTPDAWHDVLGDLPLAGARAAAAAVARRQTFVSPAEIRTEFVKVRETAAADIQGPGLPAEIPDADPDDVRSYLEAIRQQRTRAASGQPLRRRRPVAELVAAAGRSVPAVDELIASVRRAGPLGVECPTCQAPIGHSCKTPAIAGRPRRERDPHDARQATARGQTPPDPHAEEQRRRDAAARLATTDHGRHTE